MRTVLLLLATVGLLIAALLSSPVGARSDDIEEITPPVPFHGTIACTGVISGGIPDIRPEVTFNRGEIYQAEGDVSDPRLQGSYTAFFNSDNYKSPDLTTSLGSGLWRIENEAGAWQGSYNVIGLPFEGSVRTSTTTTILVGEGEYEGLLAVWEVDFDNRACEWTVNGLVVEGELPPTPDVVSTPTNDPPSCTKATWATAARLVDIDTPLRAVSPQDRFDRRRPLIERRTERCTRRSEVESRQPGRTDIGEDRSGQ